MSTVANNGTVYAYIASAPVGNCEIVWWGKIGTGVINQPNYGQTFELDYSGSGDYLQLYTDISSSDPQFRRFSALSGDGLIRAAGTYIDIWFKFLLKRVANVWTLYIATEADAVWTTVFNMTQATAPSSICFFGSYLDLGNYVIPNSSVRSARVYVGGHANADLLTDLDSLTPTLGSIWARWFEGASASLSGTDASGNGRTLTIAGGTLIADPDDPLVGVEPEITYNSLFFGMNF